MSYENSPRRPPSSNSGSRSWTEWTQQLNAYIAWVNSQLRKKPGSREVKDLRREVQDGTVLVELIEIIAGEKIPGAHYTPTNSLEMKENVERVLHFMRSRKIKMHQIRASDIVEGNMKSIMRLILALAAHFKPSSVKQSSHSQVKKNNSLGIAQEAASTLASIRKDAESIKRKMHRPASLEQSNKLSHLPATVNRQLDYGDDEGAGASPVVSRRNASSSKSSHDSSSEGEITERYSTILDDVNENNCVMLDEAKSTHSLLVELQNLLLNGDDEDTELSLIMNDENEPPTQEQSRLQQSTELCDRLKEELSRSKQECMQLQGMKQGLHQRLSEQQQEILQMKAKALRSDICTEDTETDKEELREQLTEKTTMLNRLQTEVERRDKTIAHLQKELLAKTTHTNEIIKSLEHQITELQGRITLDNKERPAEPEKLMILENLDPKLVSEVSATREIDIAERAIESLRRDGLENSSHVNAIETAFVTLVNRLKESAKQQKPTVEVKGHKALQRATGKKGDSTKVLCFSAKSVTPAMKTIHKKLGEVTLADFKAVFAPSDGGEGLRKRYQFKAQDPEFGTVKEELAEDDDIIPGWEGKIIGWIEEDLA